MKNKIALTVALLAGQTFFASAAFAQSETDKCIEALWRAPVPHIGQLDMSGGTMEDDRTEDLSASDDMAYTGDDIAYNEEQNAAGDNGNSDATSTEAPKSSRHRRGGHARGKSKRGIKHPKKRLSSRPRGQTAPQSSDSPCCAPAGSAM